MSHAMLPPPAKKIIEQCRANREDDGAAVIRAKDVAVLIRAQLKARWPKVKFSVRSEHDSVNVHWADGPRQKLVEGLIGEYNFGGFDGMIDLPYSSSNWLLPDGRMSPAASTGTEGSRGTVAGYVTDCPQPGALLVKYGPRYVFAQRQVSEERYRFLARFMEEQKGWTVDLNQPLWQQRYPNGEYVPSELLRLEEEADQHHGDRQPG